MMERERKTIVAMIKMYCSAHHRQGARLCGECAGLLGYASLRLDKCPFGKDKPACAKCTTHCYSPAMRAKVTSVMRYAGPRMISKHPVLAFFHGVRSI